MAKHKKSSFYHTRFNKVRINVTVAAEVLGVSEEDVLRFDADGSPMAERCLLYWSSKQVSYDGWQGFYFSRGSLHYKKLQFTPESLLYLRKCADENESLRRRLREFETHTNSLSLGAGKFLTIAR